MDAPQGVARQKPPERGLRAVETIVVAPPQVNHDATTAEPGAPYHRQVPQKTGPGLGEREINPAAPGAESADKPGQGNKALQDPRRGDPRRRKVALGADIHHLAIMAAAPQGLA